MDIIVPISMGELIDKLSILDIKLRKIDQKSKKKNIQKEYKILEKQYLKIKKKYDKVDYYLNEIKSVNEEIWRLQELSKEKILINNFDKEYVILSTNIHNLNDKRFQLKSDINALFDSKIIEEKSYQHLNIKNI